MKSQIILKMFSKTTKNTTALPAAAQAGTSRHKIRRQTLHKLRNRLGDARVEKLVCVKQHLITGTKSKKQLEIDFGLDSTSDSDVTIDNREEVPDDENLYSESNDVSDIHHVEIVN